MRRAFRGKQEGHFAPFRAGALLVASLLSACGSQSQSPVEMPPPPATSEDIFLAASSDGFAAELSNTTGLLQPIAGGFVHFSSPLFQFAANSTGTRAAALSGTPASGSLQAATIGAVGQISLVSGSLNLVNTAGLAVSADGIIAVSFSGTSLVSLYAISGSQIVPGTSAAVGPAPQDLAFSPSGTFLYVADNASGEVFVFSVSSASSMQLVGMTQMPSSGVSPALVRVRLNSTGTKLAATTLDGVLYVADVDAATGAISNVVEVVAATGANLESVLFDPSSTYVYTANQDTSGIFEFSLGMGNPQPLPGSPAFTLTGPVDFAITSAGDRLYLLGIANEIQTYFRFQQTGAFFPAQQTLSFNMGMGLRLVRIPAH